MVRALVLSLTFAFLAACVVQAPPGEQDLRLLAPGSYVGTSPDGQQLSLVLEADGTGSINGMPGTWQVQYGRLFLSDGQQQVPADLVGNQLTVYLPQGQVTFVRAGAAAGTATAGAAPGYGEGAQPGTYDPYAGQGYDDGAAAEDYGDGYEGDEYGGAAPGDHDEGGAAPGYGAGGSTAARPFAPKLLRGRKVRPEGTGTSFRVPRGWRHGPTQAPDGSAAYSVQREDGTGGMMLRRKALSAADQQQPVSALLSPAIQELTGGHPVQTVVAPEDLDIGGQRGARAIVRGNVNGRALELYVAGVVVGSHGYLIAGLYESSRADDMRPAVDTVLATFRASAVPENRQLRARLIGCWEHYEGDTSVNGSFNSTTRISLSPDGSYSYHYFTSISGSMGAGGTSERRDAGSYRVEGNTLVGTSSQDGSTSSFEVSLRGGILYLDGQKYLPCRR